MEQLANVKNLRSGYLITLTATIFLIGICANAFARDIPPQAEHYVADRDYKNFI